VRWLVVRRGISDDGKLHEPLQPMAGIEPAPPLV
jgi:hypothetical protein